MSAFFITVEYIYNLTGHDLCMYLYSVKSKHVVFKDRKQSSTTPIDFFASTTSKQGTFSGITMIEIELYNTYSKFPG